ncbi:MAG: hypothetical protein EAZ92_00805 [Candidatus Kapaibacterium sp.]|nr:MAG: hypothetical protein EAZ92_00805 [Candidatus Kapabacteria bacterium]
MQARKANFTVSYNGKNITEDISQFCETVTYTDKLEAQSDEIDITLENKDGRWFNEWYPEKGATLQVRLYDDALQLNCGVFTLDEIEFTDGVGGSRVSIRGLAANYSKAIRSSTSIAHENKSLQQIINQVAAKHGFTVVGTVAPIHFNRITQHQQTDLDFLQCLAKQYGYVMNVRNNDLIFTDLFTLEDAPHILTLNRNQIGSFRVTDKLSQTFKSSKVVHYYTRDKKRVEYTTREGKQQTAPDDLNTVERAENETQANRKSKVNLHRANSKIVTGRVDVEGNLLLVAGVNLHINAMGKLAGIYQAISSVHTVDSSGGYSTNLDVKRLRNV